MKVKDESENVGLKLNILKTEIRDDKSLTVSIVSKSICHEMMGLNAMIFDF